MRRASLPSRAKARPQGGSRETISVMGHRSASSEGWLWRAVHTLPHELTQQGWEPGAQLAIVSLCLSHRYVLSLLLPV